MSRQKYPSNLLAQACLTDNCIVDTPMELSHKLRPTDSVSLTKMSAYLCIGLPDHFSPNIVYDVHVVSQFVGAPRCVHCTTVLRILHIIWHVLSIITR